MSTELMPESSGNVEKEIAFLEQKLAEKRASLGKPESFSERDIIKETIRERMSETPVFSVQQKTTSPAPKNKKPTPIPLVATGKVTADELGRLSKEKQLDILVGVAMTQSIPESVILAQATNNPYILDELHDVLVDKFYGELVKRGKI